MYYMYLGQACTQKIYFGRGVGVKVLSISLTETTDVSLHYKNAYLIFFYNFEVGAGL